MQPPPHSCGAQGPGALTGTWVLRKGTGKKRGKKGEKGRKKRQKKIVWAESWGAAGRCGSSAAAHLPMRGGCVLSGAGAEARPRAPDLEAGETFPQTLPPGPGPFPYHFPGPSGRAAGSGRPGAPLSGSPPPPSIPLSFSPCPPPLPSLPFPAGGGGGAVPGSAPRFPAHPRPRARLPGPPHSSAPPDPSAARVFFTSPPPPSHFLLTYPGQSRGVRGGQTRPSPPPL